MTSGRDAIPPALALICVLTAATAVAAAQQPQPKPATTGVLVMAKDGASGSIVHEGSFDAVYKAVRKAADPHGDGVLADADTITAGLGPFRPDGSQLTLTIALAKLADGRIQVQVTARDPSGGIPQKGPARATVKSYVTALSAVLSATPIDPKLTATRVYIFTAQTEPGLRNRKDAIADLRHCLKPLPIEMVPDGAKGKARVWLEVIRRAENEGLTVRLTVPGSRYSTVWTEDSPRDVGAARQIKAVFKGWLNANRERLLSGKRLLPLPAGVDCVGAADPPPPTTSASPERVRLFLGPAEATDGFVNYHPGFADSYRDLCNGYKSDQSFRSVLTIVTDRDEADLALEITFRNTPVLYTYGKEELRAELSVIRPGVTVAMNGRTGADPSTLTWRTEARALLRQTVNWIEANGVVLEQARAARVAKTREP